MKEFDYDLDYKALDFSVEENRNLYRIGRGEQGVYWFALILTLFVIIGDLELQMKQ